jgi:uncharacterized membrane protein
MTVSHMRVAKSETREFGERDRVRLSLGEPSEWNMSNATFFTAFVVIAGVLTVLAIVLR